MIRPIRKFTEILGLLDRGRFAEACDHEVARAIETLENLPKEKGSATVTVELAIHYENGRVDLAPRIKSKLPEDKAFGRTPFWAHEGALSTQHPSQTDMFGPRAAEPAASEESAESA